MKSPDEHLLHLKLRVFVLFQFLFFFFFFLPFCLPKPNHGGEKFGDTPANEAVDGGLTHSHGNKTRTAFLEGTLTVLSLKKGSPLDSAFLLFVS